VAHIWQRRERARGQPAGHEDGVTGAEAATASIFVTGADTAAANFRPSATIGSAAAEFFAWRASFFPYCADCAATTTARSRMGGHTSKFSISTWEPASPKSMVGVAFNLCK
jgi:hypothetical protein